jgi:hypothetical protein
MNTLLCDTTFIPLNYGGKYVEKINPVPTRYQFARVYLTMQF